MRHLLLFVIALLYLTVSGIQIKTQIDLDESGNLHNLKSFKICNDSIYALDSRQKVLFKYNKDGSFLNSRPADGRGPGEFEYIPNRIHCLKSGNILMVETNRFHYFTPDLEFIETKLFDPVAYMKVWQLAEVLAEFDSAYLISFSSTSELSNNQYAIINKNDLSVEESFGFPSLTSNRLLGRGQSTYSNGIIITFLGLTGDIIIYDIEKENYHSFNIQNKVSIDELEKKVPTRVRPGDREFLNFLEEGFVINNLGLYNDHILVIQDKYSEHPGNNIDIYSLEGSLLSSITLPENINGFSVIDNQLYGRYEFEPSIYLFDIDLPQ